MRGAYVVRLGPGTDFAGGHFEGSVEEVDTGKRLKFQSTDELLKFLGQSLEEARRRETGPQSKQEQQDDE
jgi:hypothetical protein